MTSRPEAIDLEALRCQQPTAAVVRAALPVLDAELVAVDGVPVKDLVPIVDEWVPGQFKVRQLKVRQLKVRQPWREDPAVPLFAVGGLLVAGILGTAVYGAMACWRSPWRCAWTATSCARW